MSFGIRVYPKAERASRSAFIESALERVPFLVGQPVDRHLSIARQRLGFPMCFLRCEHRQVRRLRRLLGGGHDPNDTQLHRAPDHRHRLATPCSNRACRSAAVWSSTSASQASTASLQSSRRPSDVIETSSPVGGSASSRAACSSSMVIGKTFPATSAGYRDRRTADAERTRSGRFGASAAQLRRAFGMGGTLLSGSLRCPPP